MPRPRQTNAAWMNSLQRSQDWRYGRQQTQQVPTSATDNEDSSLPPPTQTTDSSGQNVDWNRPAPSGFNYNHATGRLEPVPVTQGPGPITTDDLSRSMGGFIDTRNLDFPNGRVGDNPRATITRPADSYFNLGPGDVAASDENVGFNDQNTFQTPTARVDTGSQNVAPNEDVGPSTGFDFIRPNSYFDLGAGDTTNADAASGNADANPFADQGWNANAGANIAPNENVGPNPGVNITYPDEQTAQFQPPDNGGYPAPGNGGYPAPGSGNDRGDWFNSYPVPGLSSSPVPGEDSMGSIGDAGFTANRDNAVANRGIPWWARALQTVSDAFSNIGNSGAFGGGGGRSSAVFNPFGMQSYSPYAGGAFGGGYGGPVSRISGGLGFGGNMSTPNTSATFINQSKNL